MELKLELLTYSWDILLHNNICLPSRRSYYLCKISFTFTSCVSMITMMPNRSGQFSPNYIPASVSFNMDATQYMSYCMSPMSGRVDSPLGSVGSQQNSPRNRMSPLSFHPFVQCPSSHSMDMESPPVFGPMSSPGTPVTPRSPSSCRKCIPNSVAYEMEYGTNSQYCLSPITVEMEKFFSYPTMSVRFMPCVCVPDYPVEEGKPRKICRRCSVTPTTTR